MRIPLRRCPQQMQAFGINGGIAAGLQRLFMSHPPLEERIAALEQRRGNAKSAQLIAT